MTTGNIVMKIDYTKFETIAFMIKVNLKSKIKRLKVKIPKEGSTKNKIIIRNNKSK